MSINTLYADTHEPQRRIFKICALCIGLTILASCGGGEGSGQGTAVGEVINGQTVPPAPVDATATVLGTDINNNGIRDDVERRLAARVGAVPAVYAAANTTARNLQRAVAEPTSSASAQAMASFVALQACGSAAEKAGAAVAADESLDNRERQEAAIKAYLGGLNSSSAAETSASGVIFCN